MINKAAPVQAREKFRDRSRRLALFGILAIILGMSGTLLGLAHLLPLLMGSRLFGDPQSLLMSALTYGIISAILVWAGIGSLRMRRWTQPMMLTIGWCWLIAGLFCLLLVAGLLEELYILATSGLEELPAHAGIIVKSFLLGAVFLGGVLLPALFVLVYRDGDILRTCEQHDPAPSWTDRCPRPVLAISTALGLAALLSLPLALKPLFPLFGILVTGWAGALMILASAAYLAYLAQASFKLAPSAWWGTCVYILLLGVSTAMTILRVDLLLLLRALGHSGAELDGLLGSGALWRPLSLSITLLMTLVSLVYMLTIRKYYANESAQT
jgi:hypothetical protein